MEVAGFAIGVVSLAALLDTCVELANGIRLMSNLGHDYEVTYTKFLLLRSRLSALGNSLREIEDSSPDSESTRAQWQADRNLVGKALVSVKGLLGDAQSLELKYGLRDCSKSQVASMTNNNYDNHDPQPPPSYAQSATLTEIEESFDASIQRRSSKVSVRRRLTWAISDKKKFDELIRELSFHINELEALANRFDAPPSKSVIKKSLQHVKSSRAMELIQQAAASPELTTTIYDGSQHESFGHQYVRNIVDERARLIEGNIGVLNGPGNRRHQYVENVVAGEGQVVMGDMSVDAMKAFFGR